MQKGFRIARGRALFFRGEAYYPGDEARVTGLDEKAIRRLVQLGTLVAVKVKEVPPEPPAAELSATPLADRLELKRPRKAVQVAEKVVEKRLPGRPKVKVKKRERDKIAREKAIAAAEKRKAMRGYKPAREGAEEAQYKLMAEVNGLSLSEIPSRIATITSSWEVLQMRYLDARPHAKVIYDARLRELAG